MKVKFIRIVFVLYVGHWSHFGLGFVKELMDFFVLNDGWIVRRICIQFDCYLLKLYKKVASDGLCF